MRERLGVAVARCGAVLALGVALLGCAVAAVPPPQQLRDAQRSIGDAPALAVALPDKVDAESPEQPARATYRLRARLGEAPTRVALYLPGLLARARIAVNGQVLLDQLREAPSPPPRGADRLLLAAVPDAFLRAGANDIELTLVAPRRLGLSALWIGDADALGAMHAGKLRWQVIGPLVGAAVIAALSLCVLLLWARRPAEAMYAYFGFGGLLWALHNVWTVLPSTLLPQPHFSIWWTSGYPFFVAPLVVFCLRLAQWRMPRFEFLLWAGVALGPALLYAAHAAGVLDDALAYWRLVWIGAVAVAVYAVGRYALARRDTPAMLLIATGGVAFAFALRDWLLDRQGTDNNPVFLTSYSGLLFFPLVGWMLIDGFVQASRELERLNADLEQRVAAKSAQLQAALDEMRAAKESAETADRAKSTFLAAASHDLRQPVHALGLFTAALREEPLQPAQRELVERVSESVGALDAMFDALLDVSRIDAGAVEARPRAFALEPLLHRLADEFARQAADKGLRLSVRMAPAVRRLNAHSDPLLVERMVRNLLGNAVKHTADGGVLLACRLRGGASRWRIEVWDTGPGIPEAERERVFDEFYQLGNPERDRAAGLGLGLAIVRRIGRLLDHPVSLRSTPGRGSCFAFELPATAEAPAHTMPPPALGSVAGLRVAVVDDDPQVRDGMAVLLGRWDCDVVLGADADDVLRQLAQRPSRHLHAALVDLQLHGGRSGIDAIAALRAACGAALPALLVSGASAPQRLAELQASGFEWLTKPVPPARLRSWLLHATRFARCGDGEPLRTPRELEVAKEG